MAAPARHDHRIILHFDYDCFYASVFEVEQPVLKSLPLAVQQKQIVVTCNYEARRRGLRKLQLISEAKQICPEVVIVRGEDLSKFRDASKALYLFLRQIIWGGQAERLGFDEVFLDVTDMVAYNVEVLNRNDLAHSFFHLDQRDPTAGFAYDATQPRLLVASHLAAYLRGQIEEQKGYTATVGVSTSKLLAKLAGNQHKPNSQTTLLPPYTEAQGQPPSNVLGFLDPHDIRKIPGIGAKLAQKLTSYRVASSEASTSDSALGPVTVQDIRQAPGMGPALLDRLLGGPGSPKDIGVKVWRLLHGVDSSEVLQARDLPTQISIEDSYGRLDTVEGVRKELVALASSLIRRMRTDLTDKDPSDSAGSATRWVAYPRTFRLSTRPRLPSETSQAYNANRISRSAPLPAFVFHLEDSVDALAERLVEELALGMFRKLHPPKSGWNLRLMNLAVTNMIDGAGDRKQSSGRDIAKMFQTQERVADDASGPSLPPAPDLDRSDPCDIAEDDLNAEPGWEESDEEDGMACIACVTCGALIPHFALVAHEVYHAAPD